MPLFLFFRKTRTIICTFLFVNLLFIIMAVTPVGFPYKAKQAPQRFSLLVSLFVKRIEKIRIKIW